MANYYRPGLCNPRHLLDLFIAGTCCLLLFNACHQPNPQHKKIFHYNEATGIATLDPAFAKNQSIMWPVHQLYNTLVEVNDSMQLKPSLATSWEFSTDRRSVTFHLRQDVQFHDDACFPGGKGRKLVAADIAYSLSRIIDGKLASPGAWIFNDRVDSLQPFLAINDSTFRLSLLRPFQPILGILSMQYCSIVPHEAVTHYGKEFRRHPVGTGPFRFVAWEEGQALIMQKNPSYFEKDQQGNVLPYMDGIKVSFYDSRATEFLEFQQGKLDFINDIDASFKDEILTKTGNLKKEWVGKLNLHKHPYLNIEYFGVLMDSTNPLVKGSPLRRLALRKAIGFAIDRPKMMMYLRNSIGIPANSGFVPEGLPSFDAQSVRGFSYSPDSVRYYLDKAGIDASHPMPLVKLLTIPNYANLGSYVANELNLLGIKVQVEVLQKSLLLEQTSKSQALFFRGSWIADYPDAENYLSVFYGKNPAPPNYTRYNNPAYDALYERALAETSDSVRYGIYRQMDNLIMHDVPVIPLWYDMVLHLVHTNISGFTPNSLNMLELRKVKKD